MRVGGGTGGEAGSRQVVRGGGGSNKKAPSTVVMRTKGGVDEGDAAGGCSASSTSRSSGRRSSRADSPLTSVSSHVRGAAPARTGCLDPDGGLLTSSSSYASAVSTEPQEEDDDGSGASEGDKHERWVHGRLQHPANSGVPRSNGGGRRHGARKDRAQRPASLDFGCPGAVARPSTQSPGSSASVAGAMNKGPGGVPSHYRPDALSSPGTPNYRRRGTAVVAAAGHQHQGCHSPAETVLPPAASRHRRHPAGSSVAALPYNSNGGGRTLPSKWEDAERWIFSPSTGNVPPVPGRPSVPQLWRPKSKSGPLGPPNRFGEPCSYASSSSAAFLHNGGGFGNVAATNAPFSGDGVLLPEHDGCGGSSVHNGSRDLSSEASGEESSNGRGGRYSQSRQHATRCTTISKHSESYQSLPSSHESIQDVQSETTKDSTASSFPVIARKDVATQTSPDISRPSSPNKRPSFSRSLSAQQAQELESCFSKLEIRDVQIDDRVTLTRWSKKHVTRGSDKKSTNIIEWKKKTMESKSSAWEVTETAKCISKIEGEEAKMTAWENMQKAKAEAAIQKLVIKLEKKRIYSLERIFNALRSGHRRTQVLRTTATANHDQRISRTIKRTPNLSKNGQTSSLSGCFTCHAF